MVVLVAGANVLLNPPNFKFISRRSIFREHTGLIIKHFSSFRRGEVHCRRLLFLRMEVYLSSSIWFQISEETPWKRIRHQVVSGTMTDVSTLIETDQY